MQQPFDRRAYPQTVGPLFEAAVQVDEISGDEKLLLDADPQAPLPVIRERFRDRRDDEDFDIESFLSAHFDLSNDPPETPVTGETVTEHVERLWPVLESQFDEASPGSTVVPVPEPDVTPGGVFRELYYWDSYFTAEGLVATGHTDRLLATVRNVASLIDRFGFVPNATRVYYTSRSQPPVFGLLLGILGEVFDTARAQQYADELRREYDFWMEDRDSETAHRRVVTMPDGTPLNRHWDDRATPRPESYTRDCRLAERLPADDRPAFFRNVRAACESGWDFSSRWRETADDPTTTRTTDIVPVDLNAFLYASERMLVHLAATRGDSETANRYRRAADRRREAIRRYCWDDSTGLYVDYDWRRQTTTGRETLAGVVPLFVGLATPERAARVAETVETRFLASGGVRTTTVESGEQWDAPNGWAPLHWMAAVGLRRYGHDTLASQIERRWLDTVRRRFEREGRLIEKYDVVDPGTSPTDGEYPFQDGFGWTNGVTVAFEAECYPQRVLDSLGRFLPVSEADS